ncbi:disease resistance TIR-NBS-LRR class family protein [Tanacetum coccineum]
MASTSSSPIQKSFKYDVFLSFRGGDTRNNFVGHLYQALKQKGIETYKDDEKIEKGKMIKEQLIKSIEDSRFYIIVFSKKYASSSWCLDELVKIMECEKTSDHTAYPVFHDVEPTQVRKQSGPVRKAFAKNTKKEAAQKWRDAMKEASDLAGWELKATANGDESKLIQIIVDNIFKKLRSISSSIDGKLVGMEMRINEVLASLKSCTEDVRVIGIKGMGGGGKTTLARAVYVHISSEFEGKSFVENVREVSKTSLSGLKSLQKQVLSDVLNDQGITVSSVADGKDMMGKMMRGRKVLVVLDDVDHIDQLEALAGKPNWFKSGSTIIITTRDEQVLVSHGVSLIRNVNLLSDKEALCLFSRYTFGREIPIQGYEQLSGQVARYAAGLPLTIKVLGSFLCGKNELEWKDVLERLKTVPQKETQKVLEISFDDLENDYKEIFLDVACILKGEQKDRAIHVFESCGYNANIEEMGKDIVFRLHPDDPNRQSRLWIDGEIENILACDSAHVNEAIRCIKLSPLTLNLATVMRGLGNMMKLRVLYMCSGPNWNDNQVLDRLRFLDLSYTRLQTMNLGVTPNIEILNLEHCQELIEFDIPDGCPKLQSLNLNNSKLQSLNLGPSPNLETLSLVGCCDLEEFCMPFGCPKLKSLSLDGSNLKNLNLGPTPDLEVLSLVRCCDLEELLPFRCTKIKSLSLNNSRLRNLDFGPTPDLETLSLAECDLEAFHVPFRCPKLKSLSLNGSKLRNLHLGLTRDLETLSLAGCDLEELHAPFGCPKLISLVLNNSKMRNLNLGPTPDLENLSLAGCDLEELHMPFGYPKLISLILNNSKLRNLNLGPTPKLENLSLDGCDLEEFYVPFGCPKLKSLSLNSSGLKNFILGPTPDLEILSLIGYNLEELRMPSRRLNLRSLDLCHSKLRTLDIELTPNLERLDLKDCLNLTEINAPIGCLKKLVYLDLSGCGRYKSFLFDKRSRTLDVGCLSELHLIAHPIDRCPMHPVNNLPKFQFTCFYEEDPAAASFGNLEKLISIGLCSCTNLKSFSKSICSLQCLKKLTFEGDISEVTENVHQLQSLEELSICKVFIEDLPDSVCMLKQLKSLKLESCWRLRTLPNDFGKLESLEKLMLSSSSISRLPDSICRLKHLKYLEIEGLLWNQKLLEDLGRPQCLEKLILRYFRFCENFPKSIFELKRLKYFHLLNCTLDDLPEELGHLECLEELDITGTYISHLPHSIFQLKGLRIIGFERTLELCGLTPVKRTSDNGDNETFCYTVV